MCLAQGPQRSDAGEARTHGPRSRVKHCTTEPLRSLLSGIIFLSIIQCNPFIAHLAPMFFTFEFDKKNYRKNDYEIPLQNCPYIRRFIRMDPKHSII